MVCQSLRILSVREKVDRQAVRVFAFDEVWPKAALGRAFFKHSPYVACHNNPPSMSFGLVGSSSLGGLQVQKSMTPSESTNTRKNHPLFAGTSIVRLRQSRSG